MVNLYYLTRALNVHICILARTLSVGFFYMY